MTRKPLKKLDLIYLGKEKNIVNNIELNSALK